MRRARSLALLLIPTLLAFLSACATGSGAPKGEWQPAPWPIGRFELVADVQYRMDSETSTRTERAEYRAQLDVFSDEEMELQSSSGLCARQTRHEIEMDIAQGRRTFSCQEVTYVLKPLGETVGGTARVSVSEGIRTRGSCLQWEDTGSGGRRCLEYLWVVNTREVVKTAPVRVLPRRAALPSSFTTYDDLHERLGAT